MQIGVYVLTLAVSIVGAAIAVFLGQRWPRYWAATVWASTLFALMTVVGFRLTTGRLPPLPQVDHSAAAEPWELLVLPLVLLSIVWPLLRELAAGAIGVRTWLAMAMASVPLAVSLPTGESYSDVIPGNAGWMLLALLAIGANALAGEQLDASGAARWSLWVFVAQLFTVAALLMTCYGTLGEWCAIAALSLGVLAAGRLFISAGNWSGAVGLTATTLACVLLSHIRVYSSLALPTWLAPLPLLLPSIIGLIDASVMRNRSGWLRAMTAAAASAIIAVIVIAVVLSGGGAAGGSDDWSAVD